MDLHKGKQLANEHHNKQKITTECIVLCDSYPLFNNFNFSEIFSTTSICTSLYKTIVSMHCSQAEDEIKKKIVV